MRVAYTHNNCNFVEMYRLTPTEEEEEALPVKSDVLVIQPQNIQSEETMEYIKGLMPDVFFVADESAFIPPDILEGLSLTYTAGSLWDNSSASPAKNQYTSAYTSIEPLIDVLEGHTYKIPKFYGIVKLYDATGANSASLECFDAYLGKDFEFTIPEGKTRIGISYQHANKNIPAVEKVYRLTMTEEEEEALPVKNDKFSVQTKNIVNDDTKALLCPLKDKIIVNFGDSIFGNARPPEDISTRLAELTGATVHNCGFGGCRMASHTDVNYDAFSMTKLADAIASKDFTLQENALTNTEGSAVPSYFAETVALLKTIDFEKVNIITIAYGTNDHNGISLDNATKNSFAGALRYSIETIITAYPHLKIFICSPTYRFWMDANGAFTEDSDTKTGGYGYTLIELLEKAREVAEEYKMPFIDNYHIGINKFNRGYYFPATDGVHHNITGRKLIAEHIAKELF
jgi:lysophospholipase L1-like esterase